MKNAPPHRYDYARRTHLGEGNSGPRAQPEGQSELRGSASIPQGMRERRRRVKQIIKGQTDFSQLGLTREHAMDEFSLAKKNALVGAKGRK